MKLRVANVVTESIVDGPGLRATVFVQGCSHNCPGCQNPLTHDYEGGVEMNTLDILQGINANPLLKGITISGGEPFDQARACAELAFFAKMHGLDVWVYTGYTYEELLERKDPDVTALLCQTDVLVDGPFIESKKSLGLKWRGSSNQRIIDVPMSLECGAVVMYEE